MSDTFAGTGVKSIVKPLTPRGEGWTELQVNPTHSLGFPCRGFIHKSGLFAMSAVETVQGEDKGPEYHISISQQTTGRATRCDSNEAKWVLRQFGLDGAEEDNHVPYGVVRNFWRPVATGLIGLECPCKEEEPMIKEDRGDFVWRPAS
jgi:hypothetical protein